MIFAVEIMLLSVAIYMAVGVVFALLFVFSGAGRVDDSAQGASVFFKILIFPGSMIFWPFLLKKWIRSPKKKL